MINQISFYFRSLVKKPFKVGLISYYYPEKEKLNNGVAIHTYYLSRELAKLGCEVHIFASGDKNSKKKQYLGEGKLVIHRINSDPKLKIKNGVLNKRIDYLVFDNHVINQVIKENTNEKFDILHSHGWLTSGAFISKYFNDVKWIHTFHAIEKNRLKFMTSEEKKYFKIAKWIESSINHADAIITVSNRLKIEALQTYPIKKEKIYTIPNGVDLSLFNTNYPTTHEKKILYIGRFSNEKGIDIVLKIAKEILKKDVEIKFILVSSDKGIPSLEKVRKGFEALQEEYPERIHWYREDLSLEKIAELHKESIIYIQPSRYESFGMCVLEAMACGEAVIVSNKGGLPEVVENAGIVIPLKTNLFTKEILKLVEDFKLRERYVRRAIERSKEFSWEDIAKRTLALYRKVSGQEDKRKGIKEEDKIEIEPKVKLENKKTLNSIW